jgi:hypothetical protein
VETSILFGLIILAGVLVLAAVGVFVMRGRSTAPPAAPQPVAKIDLPPATSTEPDLQATLARLQQEGRWDDIYRLLDRTLPEWTTSSSLIEVARAIGALETDLAAAPSAALPLVVTERLQTQAHAVTRDLWSLAQRLENASRLGSSRMRQELEREDEILFRLLPAIREARIEMDRLLIASAGQPSLQKAEDRFLSLADTARELRRFEEDSTIR